MNTTAYDAVIVGGGLSGLSLAAHLAASDWRERSLLVVDDETLNPTATCWGWWSAAPGLLDGAVSRTFAQVGIRAAGTSRVVSLGGHRYRVVRRDDLRLTVVPMLCACPRFELVHGHVDAVRDRGDAADVVVDGRVIRAGWVFDSVSSRVQTAGVDARLAFTGYEVHSARPAFDPDTPTLFDFTASESGRARFFYVLPQDEHRALVELTEFVPRHRQAPAEPDRRQGLEAYLRTVTPGQGMEILRTESAALGLRANPGSRRTGRVVAIGAQAGLIKASTGYAYQRIQRDSAAIAGSMARHGHPLDLPRRRFRHGLLDALLLDVLDRNPSELEHSFARLFARNPAERILRFLDEETSIAEELALITSMRPGPYLGALARRALRRP